MPDSNDDSDSVESYEPSDEEKEKIDTWTDRFQLAKEYRQPIEDKWQRMYEIFRAYRDEEDYPYHTNLVPPIGFQIIQTLVSRLATADREIGIKPRTKDFADEEENMEKWEELLNWYLKEADFSEKQKMWMQHSGIYGDGLLKVMWDEDKGRPDIEIVDLWDYFPAPDAQSDTDLPWAIHRVIKPKSELDEDLYDNLECVDDGDPEDLKRDRYKLHSKKMGKISGAKGEEESRDELPDKQDKRDQDMVELLEIWDYQNDELLVIANQEVLIRWEEENPYKNAREGKVFVDLYDHRVFGEFFNIGHLEPVETTIHELADLRNQRLEDTALLLDPVVKIKKNAGIDTDDIVFEPGAEWELKNLNDVMIDRPPEVSPMGQNEDQMLRNEISSTLAMSEYMQGSPQSSQEPAAKVQMLLKQGNLRMNLNSDALEKAYTELANLLIEITEEFASEDSITYAVDEEMEREFREFGHEDIEKSEIEAEVRINPVAPKSPQQKFKDIMTLYEVFVGKDKPKTPGEKEQWKKRKRVLQEEMLKETDREALVEELLGDEDKEPEQEEEAEEEPEATKPEKPQRPQKPQQRRRPQSPPQGQGGKGRPPQPNQGGLDKIPLQGNNQ